MPVDHADAPQFLATDVCRAAGISAATLKNWISRSTGDAGPVIPMTDVDRKASASGSPHLFSFRRVMQVALTQRLAALGIPVKRASLAALKFTDIGGSERAYHAGEIPIVRGPCEHFMEGDTYLVLFAGDETPGRLINVKDGEDALPKIEAQAYMRGMSGVAAIVTVKHVEIEVRQTLGLPIAIHRGGPAMANPLGDAND